MPFLGQPAEARARHGEVGDSIQARTVIPRNGGSAGQAYIGAQLWTTMWIPAAQVATPDLPCAPLSRRRAKGRGEGSGAACLSTN